MRIYVDMDDVLCAYTRGFDEGRKLYPDVQYPQSLEGFFINLQPIEGAIEAVLQLRVDPRFELYILTAPSTRNPHSYTEKRLWVEKYFDYEFTQNLIMCSNKSLLKGDLLIDDHASGRGQENFEGEFIHFGQGIYKNWQAVLKAIENLARLKEKSV